MIELTEQQEQEMIDRAKSGDPEANYQMSLWALEQAMAEPDEERWNRLAAKCLVKAAEAGYAPAKEKMDELLVQTAEAEPAPAGAHEAPAAPAEPTPAPEAEAQQTVTPAHVIAAEADEEEPAPTAPAAPAKPRIDVAAITAGFAGIAAKAKGLFAKKPAAESGTATAASTQEAPAETASGDAGNAGAKKLPAFLNFSQWDDAKWKKMQTICIIVCVILAILIAVMLISGRNKRGSNDKEVEEEPTIPVAEVVETPVPPAPTATPEPAAPAEPYPDDNTRAEIAAASLDVYPEDDDYVTEPTTVKVSTNGSGLNVRRGPGSNYGQVAALDNGTSVDVYAYRNGWGLVKVDGTWGWCSKDYLK